MSGAKKRTEGCVLRTRRRRGGCEGCGAFAMVSERGVPVCAHCGRPDDFPCPHCGRGQEAALTSSEIIDRIGQRMRVGHRLSGVGGKMKK